MAQIVECKECGAPYIAGKNEHCPACLALYMKFLTEVAKLKGIQAKMNFEEFIKEARKMNNGGDSRTI